MSARLQPDATVQSFTTVITMMLTYSNPLRCGGARSSANDRFLLRPPPPPESLPTSARPHRASATTHHQRYDRHVFLASATGPSDRIAPEDRHRPSDIARRPELRPRSAERESKTSLSTDHFRSVAVIDSQTSALKRRRR